MSDALTAEQWELAVRGHAAAAARAMLDAIEELEILMLLAADQTPYLVPPSLKDVRRVRQQCLAAMAELRRPDGGRLSRLAELLPPGGTEWDSIGAQVSKYVRELQQSQRAHLS